MIKIDHTITVPEINGLDNIFPLPPEIKDVLIACRKEAALRGCVFFSEANTDRTQVVASFIWDNQTLVDEFLQWADTEHNYTNVYQQYINLVESYGGTLVKTTTEY
jgi:hypothetical protein